MKPRTQTFYRVESEVEGKGRPSSTGDKDGVFRTKSGECRAGILSLDL